VCNFFGALKTHALMRGEEPVLRDEASFQASTPRVMSELTCARVTSFGR
jgi:hypothetical protein